MSELSPLFETLDQLEANLLQYEKALNNGDDTTSYIHLIFQNAHNLKSGLAFAEFIHAASLIHALEDEFDALRRGKTTPKSSTVDFCMRTIDAIQSALHNETEDSAAVLKFQSLLDEKTSQKVEKSAPPVTPAPAAEATLKTIKRYAMNLTETQSELCTHELALGKSLYRVDKLLKKTLTRVQWDTLPIRDDLNDLGRLIAVQPDFDTFQTGMEEQAVKFLFATLEPDENLKLQIYDPLILQESPPTRPAAPTPAVKRSLKILIAEDDLFSGIILKNILAAFGECTLARDGAQAWQEVTQSFTKKNLFDLIILDIMMPHKSGREILKELRQLEDEHGIQGLDRIKVVINTALGDPENIQGSFKDQADGYLIKPFTLEKITAHLKKLHLMPY